MENAKRGKARKEWKKAVDMGGAFELVDSVNEYARRKNTLLANPLG